MIYIASDHAGFITKSKIIEYLKAKSYEVCDLGTNDTQKCDYPDFAKKLCESIKENDKGILICGSGIGMSIMANRYNHIRAGLCVNCKMAQLCRKHNDCNVLVLQGRHKSIMTNKRIVKNFLTTKFAGGRHIARIEKLTKMQ